MKSYQKPIVLLNSDLSEGVYTASGDIGGSYTLAEGGTDTGSKLYSLSLTNASGENVDSVTVTLTTYGNITAIYGDKDGIVCVNNGNGTVTVSFNNHGNGFDPNETIGSIPVRVVGTGDFGIR